jgi:hypothetical protein
MSTSVHLRIAARLRYPVVVRDCVLSRPGITSRVSSRVELRVRPSRFPAQRHRAEEHVCRSHGLPSKCPGEAVMSRL